MQSRNKLLLLSKRDLIKKCKKQKLNTIRCSTKLDLAQLLLQSSNKHKTKQTTKIKKTVTSDDMQSDHNEEEEKQIISYLPFSPPSQKSWTMGVKVGNCVSKMCINCNKFYGVYDGHCSVCFKEIRNFDNYVIIAAKYSNALQPGSAF